MNKVGILMIGVNGSVSAALTSGVFAARRGLIPLRGLITELQELQDHKWLSPEEIVFGGWDFRSSESHYEWVRDKEFLDLEILEEIKEDLRRVEVFNAPLTTYLPAVMDLEGADTARHEMMTKEKALQKIREDIQSFKKKHQLRRVIVINLASTEPIYEEALSIKTLKDFEAAKALPPSFLYAYASILEDCPIVNFTPSVGFEVPFLIKLAEEKGVPLAGRDGKTGQTLYKTVLASMLKWRNLKLDGWYSTNILGNDDGKVLSDPNHAASKVKTKSDVLSHILGYDDFAQDVHIHYYPVRGDAKEAWDTIDFTGWLDTKMSMKINWLGQDSPLAAAVVFDLIRFMNRAKERKQKGILPYLASFFKAPAGTRVHDYFEQIEMLRNELG